MSEVEHWQKIAGQGVQIEHQLRCQLLKQRNEIIEECARVVEELCSERDCSVWEIVQAILALKDKP